MKRNDYLDTTDSYSYGPDFSKTKLDLPKIDTEEMIVA